MKLTVTDLSISSLMKRSFRLWDFAQITETTLYNFLEVHGGKTGDWLHETCHSVQCSPAATGHETLQVVLQSLEPGNQYTFPFKLPYYSYYKLRF